jgi:hypothetical protein
MKKVASAAGFLAPSLKNSLSGGGGYPISWIN